MKNSQMLILSLLSVFTALPAPAFAARGDRGEVSNYATLRRDIKDRSPAANLIKIEGELSCNLGGDNNGQGCDLKLTENGSHKIYNLIEASSAMRLFQDGARKVMIEGRLAGAETIEVKNAQTL